jgi:hypothetical protein
MSDTLYFDLEQELISKLDSYINDNKSKSHVSCLSNNQIPTSFSNLEIIKKSEKPSYIYAGDFSGGYYHCNYYKHTNGNIYVMNFYLQNFEEYYLLEDWERQFSNYKNSIGLNTTEA